MVLALPPGLVPRRRPAVESSVGAALVCTLPHRGYHKVNAMPKRMNAGLCPI